MMLLLNPPPCLAQGISINKLPSKRGMAVDSLNVKSLPTPRTFPFPRVGIGAAGMFYPSYGFSDPPTRGLPIPVPAKTRTLSAGMGFWQVQVRVALKYPRVTHDNP